MGYSIGVKTTFFEGYKDTGMFVVATHTAVVCNKPCGEIYILGYSITILKIPMGRHQRLNQNAENGN